MRRYRTSITILILVAALAAALPVSAAFSPVPSPSSGMTYERVIEIVDRVVGFILQMSGIAATVVTIYYGIRMVMAGGDEAAYANARKGFTWALIGSLVIFGVYTIIATVQNAANSLGG